MHAILENEWYLRQRLLIRYTCPQVQAALAPLSIKDAFLFRHPLLDPSITSPS